MTRGVPSVKGGLNRSTAVACLVVNQFATPGLGSIVGGRKIAGCGQLLLAVPGFALLMYWMVTFFHRLILSELDRPLPENSTAWAGKWGLISFGAAWLWSLFTSISLLVQTGKDTAAARGEIASK